MEDAGFARNKLFQRSRNCSNSSQVRHTWTVHSSAVGQDSSGSAVSVSPASIDLHKGNASGLPTYADLVESKHKKIKDLLTTIPGISPEDWYQYEIICIFMNETERRDERKF